MNPQLHLILPFEIIIIILKGSKLKEVCTFRMACKKFQRYIDLFVHPCVVTTIAKTHNLCSGVLYSSTILYFLNFGTHAIRKIDLLNNEITTFCGVLMKSGSKDGIGSKAKFRSPSGLALDEKREIIYISDTQNHVIRKVSLVDGKVSTIIGTQGQRGFEDGIESEARLNHPTKLALDPISNILYVNDKHNHSIRRVLLNEKRIETLCGNGKSGYKNGSFKEAMFHQPSDIVLNLETQELYVSDWWNHAIRIISLLKGTVSTLCGGEHGSEDGDLTQAKFSFPRGLGFDSHSHCLYVTDANCAVKKISLQGKGRVDTLCGEEGHFGHKDGPFPLFNSPQGIIVDPHIHSIYIMDDIGVRKVTLRNKTW